MDVLTAQQAAGASPSNPEPEKASPMKNTGIPERAQMQPPGLREGPGTHVGKGEEHRG